MWKFWPSAIKGGSDIVELDWERLGQEEERSDVERMKIRGVKVRMKVDMLRTQSIAYSLLMWKISVEC